MRTLLLISAVLLAACSDPGLRDRSLMNAVGRVTLPPDSLAAKRVRKHQHQSARPSIIGLREDPMGPLYPCDSQLIVRFADLSALQKHALPHLDEVATLLPGLGLPELPPGTLLRIRAGLPDSIVVNRVLPFAFVRTPNGILALIPVKGKLTDTHRVRRVDARYCVAGSEAAVKAYRPAATRGYYLPGDISVVAPRDAIAALSDRLGELAALEGITLPLPKGFPAVRPEEIERVDLALHFSDHDVRVDLRLAPDTTREGALTALLAALQPRPTSALGYLPANGVVTLATTASIPTWSALARALTQTQGILDARFALLGDDTAATLVLDGDGPASLVLVSHLAATDRDAVRSFLAGKEIKDLVAQAGGADGQLTYTPRAFKRHGVHIATIAGELDTATAKALRTSALIGPLAEQFTRGSIVVCIALVGDHLCIVAGERSRPVVEQIVARLAGKGDAPDANATLTKHLMDTPALEAHINLAPFFAHSAAASLPVQFAVGAEGGALRMAARLPDIELAAVVRRLGLFAAPAPAAKQD